MNFLKYIFVFSALLLPISSIFGSTPSVIPNETAKGRFETLNKMGWAIGPEEEYSQAFIKYASQTKGWSMEVGAAYGLTTQEAIKKGAKIVINDLDARHLTFFKGKLDADLQKNVQLKPGNFLDLKIKPNSFDAILAARVLHMLSGEDIDKAANLMYAWLKPGGKVFIVAGTPYQKTWINFIPHYEKLKKSNLKYPGEITNVAQWNKEQSKYLPSFVHLLDIDVLENAFKKAGFTVEKAGYIDRGDKTQDNIFNEKKESCGLILVKK